MTKNNKILCHIVNLSSHDKDKIKEICEKLNYNMIDLDVINDQVLNSEEMKKLFKLYNKYQKNNNDRYKDIDKKMSNYWEDSVIEKVFESVNDKQIILIGYSHHYRLIKRKIKFNILNKFIIESDIHSEVRDIIKHNIENNKEEIMNGLFPIEYLDYHHITKEKTKIKESYENINYVKISLKNLIIQLNNFRKSKKLWICLNESYNIGSKIYANDDKIYSYTDPVLAILKSFDIDDYIEYDYDDELGINFKNDKVLKKLKKTRVLYYVSDETFILNDMENKMEYYTKDYALIIEKDKINNVYKKLKNLEIF